MSGIVQANVGSSSGIVEAPAGVPSGIIAFVTGSCPTGWTEYTAARGRYVLGTPSGGTGEGTAGTALSNTEDRAVGQHNHSFSGTELGTHGHSFSGTQLGTHNHSFSGSALSTHNHTFYGTDSGNASTWTTSTGIGAWASGITLGIALAQTPYKPLHNSTIGSRAAGTPSGSISSVTAGTPAGSAADITAGTPAGTIANSGSVASTNAPYIQLTCCQKD